MVNIASYLLVMRAWYADNSANTGLKSRRLTFDPTNWAQKRKSQTVAKKIVVSVLVWDL